MIYFGIHTTALEVCSLPLFCLSYKDWSEMALSSQADIITASDNWESSSNMISDLFYNELYLGLLLQE